MKLNTLAMLIVLTPGPVLACGPGETLVLSCPTDAGQRVEVCQSPTAIHYSLGKAGQPPALKLTEKNAGFVWEHGEAPGAGIMDVLVFNDGPDQHTFTVTRHDEPAHIDAHGFTRKPGKPDTYVQCESGKGKIKFNPTAIRAQAQEISEGVPDL